MTGRHSQAPSAFRQTAPDRIEIREGGGCLSLFGIPFLAAGVFLTLTGLRVAPLSNAGQVPGWAWPVLVLMGLVFVGVGGALVFGRRWVTIDRSRGVLREQRGLLVPMDRRDRSLGEFDRVTLRFEPGDSDTADRYPVGLRSPTAHDEFAVHSSSEFAESHAAAAFLADFLPLPLEDHTTGSATVRAPGEPDATLQARLRGGRERVDPVIRPRAPRSQVREGAGTASIAIPAESFRLVSLLPALVPASLFAWFGGDVLVFFRDTGTPPAVQYAFGGFVILLLVIIPLLGVLSRLRHAARGGTFVTVTTDQLTLEERGAWRSRTIAIPVADILDIVAATASRARSELKVTAAQRAEESGRGQGRSAAGATAVPRWLGSLSRLVKSDGVRVKALTGLYSFGAGLADDEVVYLAAVIKRALGERP